MPMRKLSVACSDRTDGLSLDYRGAHTLCVWSLVRQTGSRLTFGVTELQLEMWANAQRDGRPAERRWRPLFNAAEYS